MAWLFGIMGATRWLPQTSSVIEPEILGSGEPPSGSHNVERRSFSGILALKFQLKCDWLGLQVGAKFTGENLGSLPSGLAVRYHGSH